MKWDECRSQNHSRSLGHCNRTELLTIQHY